MTAPSFRTFARDPREPALHELEPIRIKGHPVTVRLAVRRADDGMWRGRAHFSCADSGSELESAEIFCGPTEAELWLSVRSFRDHHFRDLYRSLG
jgi:hypothetical protein